jgi:hypothetical protein
MTGSGSVGAEAGITAPTACATARRDRLDDLLLVDEGQLHVELRELGLPVGAQVLVAEAAADLEVLVEPRDHEDLLEDLRALRQRVPLAAVHAAGHEVVARALGRGLGEDRRLDLGEAQGRELVAQRE